MSQSVTIKSNKYGINLILDADMPFADTLSAVQFEQALLFQADIQSAVHMSVLPCKREHSCHRRIPL